MQYDIDVEYLVRRQNLVTHIAAEVCLGHRAVEFESTRLCPVDRDVGWALVQSDPNVLGNDRYGDLSTLDHHIIVG